MRHGAAASPCRSPCRASNSAAMRGLGRGLPPYHELDDALGLTGMAAMMPTGSAAIWRCVSWSADGRSSTTPPRPAPWVGSRLRFRRALGPSPIRPDAGSARCTTGACDRSSCARGTAPRAARMGGAFALPAWFDLLEWQSREHVVRSSANADQGWRCAIPVGPPIMSCAAAPGSALTRRACR
jgi:hypothetical protein